jgi:glyoxylase-like metal-dependent hydrolase (beta-lactamase superfamily II)
MSTTVDFVEIVPGLSLVPGENNGRFPFAHSFLAEGTTRALIDTGCGARVLDELRRERPMDMVIASHSHPDHTALNWQFDGTPVHAPQYAADTFGRFDLLGERFTEPGELASEWRKYASTVMHFKTALPTHTFADGDVFDFGKVSLVAIHTPGHTVDHTCFFEPTHGVLLSFDIDLTSFGPWYAHRESDIAAFETSIRKVMALQPRVIASSHKGIIADDIPARLQRYLDVFDARDRILLDLLPRAQTLDDLVSLSPFYQGYPYAAPLLRYWEEQMIRKHLARLDARGLLPYPIIDREDANDTQFL